MAFKDLGRKSPSMTAEAAPMKESKPTVSYPNLHLDMDEAPDVKIGESFDAKVKLTCTGFRQEKYGDKKFCVDFDVTAIDMGKVTVSSEEKNLSDVVSKDLEEMDED